MYQVVPGTFKPNSSGGGTVESAGRQTDAFGNPYISPLPQTSTWLPYTTVTTTNTPVSDLFENEVNVERVDNGFIINTKTRTFVAQNMVQLMEVLTKFFEEKKSE